MYTINTHNTWQFLYNSLSLLPSFKVTPTQCFVIQQQRQMKLNNNLKNKKQKTYLN